jgi:hypothetical protein
MNKRNIKESMGLPEYSYFYVLKEFLPLLRRIGDVTIAESADEVSMLVKESNVENIVLSFTTVQNTLRNIDCLTIPVFAWEYDSIPNESWDGDSRQNWMENLLEYGLCLTHSQYSKDAVTRAVGDQFPV